MKKRLLAWAMTLCLLAALMPAAAFAAELGDAELALPAGEAARSLLWASTEESLADEETETEANDGATVEDAESLEVTEDIEDVEDAGDVGEGNLPQAVAEKPVPDGEDTTKVAYIGKNGYATLAAAISAAGDGDTITLSDGTHTMPSSVNNKNITITGSQNAIIETLTAVGANGSTILFNGVTIVYDNDNYEGLQHSTKNVYNNCTIKGTMFLYAPTVEFNNCTFERYDDTTEYNVWTYGASSVSFTDCVFNTNGKAILVYTEAAHTATICASGCEFNSRGVYTGKAAIEIGQSANGAEADYTLKITNCTADNGFVANKSSSPLYGNKNEMAWQGLTVEIDGVDVTTPDFVASVTAADGSTTKYETLAEAFANAGTGASITLLQDINLSSGWTSKAAGGITLNGGGHTISGLTSPLIENTTGDVTINNLNFTGANIRVVSASGSDNDSAAGVVVKWHYNGTLTMNDVTVTNSTVVGDGYVGGLVGFAQGGTVFNTNSGCSVSNVTLTAGGVAGAFIGCSYSTGTIQGTVSGTNAITSTSDNGTRADKAGILIGRVITNTPTISATVQSGTTLSPSGNNPQRIIGSISSGGGAVITGGSYPADPTKVESGNAPTLPTGFGLIEQNGVWTLEKLPVVATIGTAEYYSLEEAINAANSAATGSSVTLTLQKDLTLENWTPVHFNNNITFVLDGNGKTITGLNAPLFKQVNAPGQESVTIQNLTIRQPAITVSGENGATGALVGWHESHDSKDILAIKNVTVTGGSITGTGDTGALIGWTGDHGAAMIENCKVENVTICGSTVGGLVGSAYGVTITDSTAGGNTLNGTATAGSVIGQITTGPCSVAVTESKSSHAPVFGKNLSSESRGGLTTITGGAYFTNPAQADVTYEGAVLGAAVPADGYAIIQQANGMYKLDTVENLEGTTSRTVNILWNDNNNEQGHRPSTLDVQFYANGDFLKTITVTPASDGTWSLVIDELPIYDDATEIRYSVKLAAVNGYTAEYSEDGFTITLTRGQTPAPAAPSVPQTGDVGVPGLWLTLLLMSMGAVTLAVAVQKKRGAR